MESNKIDNLPEPKTEIPNKNNIFHKKTFVAENDLVKVYKIKYYFKRQRISSN